MDFAQARFNMIEQQIRPWGVLDDRVLQLLASVKREAFVPESSAHLALADLELPLLAGRRMWSPKMEARVVQELHIQSSDKILEIGTGVGYLTALLAKVGRHVYSQEADFGLQAQAQAHLTAAGVHNVTLSVGTGLGGLPAQAPFDVIVLSGAVRAVPPELLAQLGIGGRLFAVIGEEPIMRATLFTAAAVGQYTEHYLFDTVLPPLLGCTQTVDFRF